MIEICVFKKPIQPTPLLILVGMCVHFAALLTKLPIVSLTKTKFRPTNFLPFSGYETPNSTTTCTAWKHVRSYHDGVPVLRRFWRLCLKINYQCVNILSFLNETLPLVIYYFVSVSEAEGILSWKQSFWCSSKSPCGTSRAPRWRW